MYLHFENVHVVNKITFHQTTSEYSYSGESAMISHIVSLLSSEDGTGMFLKYRQLDHDTV